MFFVKYYVFTLWIANLYKARNFLHFVGIGIFFSDATTFKIVFTKYSYKICE